VLRSFVYAVVAAGLLTAWFSPIGGLHDRIGTTAVLVALAVVAGAAPVRIPVMRIALAPTHPFVLAALASAGPRAAVFTALGSVVGVAYRGLKRSGPLRPLFNVGLVLLATAAASMSYVALDGEWGRPPAEMVWPLAAASIVFYLTNTGIVAAAVMLERRVPFLVAWRSSLWSAWSLLGGLTVAIAILTLLDVSLLIVAVLSVASSRLLTRFYGSHAEAVSQT
jgi:hypothetical protein